MTDAGVDGPADSNIDAVTTCALRLAFVDGKPGFSNQDDGSGRRQIWVANRDGSGMVNLSNSPDTDNAHPAWSPDGLSLAFASNRTGKYDIFVVNVGGVGLMNLTSGADVPGDASYPVWSPDGTRIAFTTMGQVWVTNANGTGAAPISTTTTPMTTGELAWSPDSTQVVFGTGSGSTFALYVATVGSSAPPLKINSGNSHESSVSWAPSSKIVFSNLTDVFTVNGNGTGLLNVTRDSAFNNGSPIPVGTGSTIAFTSTRDNGYQEIWSIPSTGGTATQITHNAMPGSADVANATTADGSIIAFSRLLQTVQSDYSVLFTSQIGVSSADGSNLHLFNAIGGSNATEARFSACR